ncbi:MAG: FKBP-type peptidyl-prolyl cis-trans isomerase [Desulfuromonadales bacterium]|nr:FKBP-type peptidyl-prolyl cis-trans isomerase [Desulfuromonadales bacterium]
MSIKSMQYTASVLFAAIVLVACATEETTAKVEPALDTSKNRISYTIGVDIGKGFKNQNMDLDADILLSGLKDAMAGKELRMTDEEMVAEIQAFQQQMQEKQASEMQSAAEDNLKAGEAFLAENAKQEDITVTESGLQYRIVEPGSGESPGPADEATVHYRGTLIDGVQFDSSIDRGQPATFPVGGVIPGWTEALQLMKPGAKWQIFIPSALAYGERGAGQSIGPNATLIFDVELISVAKGGS